MKVTVTQTIPKNVARLIAALTRLDDDGDGIVRTTEDELVRLTGDSHRTVERAIAKAKDEKQGYGLASRREGNGRNHHNVFDLAGVTVSNPSTPARMPGLNGSHDSTPANTPLSKEYSKSSESVYEGCGGSDLIQVSRDELGRMYRHHSRSWDKEMRLRDKVSTEIPKSAAVNWDAMYEIAQEIMRRYAARQESNDQA